MSEKIPGTRVPDNAIHRASLWLEDLKYGERRRDAGVERVDEFTWRAFIEETGIDATVEQLHEAADFYGTNLLVMLTGGRINIAIPSPTGEGFIDLRAILTSAWLDGFMHGAATRDGKRGLSNDEEDARDAR